MRSLITGVDGFIGSHLGEALIAAGDEVFGVARSRPQKSPSDGIVRFAGDLADAAFLERAVGDAKPERVFHLAAQNNIKSSFEDPALTMATNVSGSVHLLEALRASAPQARVVSVGSSAEYGLTARDVAPLGEELPLLPTSPYGVSKVSQGLLARVYAAVYGMAVFHVRPFAVIGPRKTRDALSDFCRNVVAIERGETVRFSVGDLTSERDFVDVRDGVAALILVSEKGVPGTVYNLCNGRTANLEAVVTLLTRLTRRPFTPTADPTRLRPADDRRIIGDNSRLRQLGYTPRFSLEETVAATLDYWRADLHRPPA